VYVHAASAQWAFTANKTSFVAIDFSWILAQLPQQQSPSCEHNAQWQQGAAACTFPPSTPPPPFDPLSGALKELIMADGAPPSDAGKLIQKQAKMSTKKLTKTHLMNRIFRLYKQYHFCSLKGVTRF